MNKYVDIAPPSLPLYLNEVIKAPHTRLSASFAPSVDLGVNGGGRPILVIPGFMASDSTTSRLRRSLNKAGFNAKGWGQGRNSRADIEIIDILLRHIDGFAKGEKTTLIGWSLGGLIAREMAKSAPEKIAKVITMGSPFSGGLKANNAWRAYQIIARQNVEDSPFVSTMGEKPPVETIAFWSANDGIVAGESACGKAGQSDVQIECDCRHMGFINDPKTMRLVAQHI
ncbi:hypothetical protein LPB140_00085 [Sphingorhabdus lutea]|uniref:AB hydrolase-1 domain-containing protein n=1 Tax=Sphingorhabdus lutea TaxID=1913578 RepID=A0A1L3J8S5_9SPHN|nr:alpha/beta hydrolase [Sphingorhabdus lutea]APG61503.1 hypothetical protein LPB140_00085 [Sphingorhabdus lutea]